MRPIFSLAIFSFMYAPFAVGWILENINAVHEIHLYQLKDNTLSDFRCPRRVTLETDTDLSECYRLNSPMALQTFQNLFRQEAEREIQLRKALVENPDRLRAKLEQVKKNADEAKKLAPSATADYAARIADVEHDVEKAIPLASKAKEELRGLEELFTANFLSEPFVHPIRQGDSDYLYLRPWVALFHHIFAMVDGKKFGRNTWWDVDLKKVWYSSLSSSTGCPANYRWLITGNFLAEQIRSWIDRFAHAIERNETGFNANYFNYVFQGGSLPVSQIADQTLQLAINYGWQLPPGQKIPGYDIRIAIDSRDKNDDPSISAILESSNSPVGGPVLCLSN